MTARADARSTEQAMNKFVPCADTLAGDEKGEAQVFCDRLFQAFGHDGFKEAGAVAAGWLGSNGRHQFATQQDFDGHSPPGLHTCRRGVKDSPAATPPMPFIVPPSPCLALSHLG